MMGMGSRRSRRRLAPRSLREPYGEDEGDTGSSGGGDSGRGSAIAGAGHIACMQ